MKCDKMIEVHTEDYDFRYGLLEDDEHVIGKHVMEYENNKRENEWIDIVTNGLPYPAVRALLYKYKQEKYIIFIFI